MRMDEKAQMLQFVGPGQPPWPRKHMPDGVKISYILNEARGIWRASWILEFRERLGHKFETSRHEEFDSAEEVGSI